MFELDTKMFFEYLRDSGCLVYQEDFQDSGVAYKGWASVEGIYTLYNTSLGYSIENSNMRVYSVKADEDNNVHCFGFENELLLKGYVCKVKGSLTSFKKRFIT